MTVFVASSISELEPYLEAWEDLSRRSLERNVFYEPWMLVPAIRYLQGKEEVRIVLIQSDSERKAPALIGLFPLVRCFGYRHLPIPYLSLWRYPQCFLCTPLVRSGRENECFSQFFTWANSSSNVGAMVRMTYIRGDGELYAALRQFLSDHRRVTDETSFERALLQSNLDGEQYIRETLTSKSRKEFERHGRRLAELGTVEIQDLREGDDIDYWVHWLLELERRGWKGKAGTALAAKQNEKEYFTEIAKAAYKRGQLMMEMLKLDGKPIAIRCTFTTGDCSYGMKIAYDEEYHRCSPGVQLEFHVIRRVLSYGRLKWMDSCAEPGHPMFDKLWKARRVIRHVNISTSAPHSKLLVRLMTVGRRLHQKQQAYMDGRKRRQTSKKARGQ